MNGSTPSVAPGTNDFVRIGVQGYQYPGYQPTIDANITFAEMEFGSNNSPVLTIANTDIDYFNFFGFSIPIGYYSYTLNLSQGLIVDANANPILESSTSGSGSLGSYPTPNISVGGTSSIAATAIINLNNQVTVTNTGNFTLNSNASGSATINYNTSGATSYFAGTYTVQRYMPGGAGYRGYRLVTLPVNINVDPTTTNQTSTEGFIDFHSLNGGMLTAGPGTGFSYATATTNPLMYLYDESRAQSFATFISGKNVGIYAMAGSPGYTVTTYGTTTGATKKQRRFL
jgi:hypothetical protein